MAHRARPLLLLAALPFLPSLLAVDSGSDGVQSTTTEYCIIGAGAAGLQLGHFLMHAGRDYRIFEKAATAGSFFDVYPRHRALISLNKRVVREGRSAEFAMRHDWNSLLDVRPEENRTVPMTRRTKELYPQADVLAQYLRDFSEEQAAHVQYKTSVEKIRQRTADSASGFELDVRDAGGLSGTVLCRQVVVATGLQVPRDGSSYVDGIELLTGYEDLPEDGESFEGKAVVVLGLGNAAFETTQALLPYTSQVYLGGRPRSMPGGAAKGLRLAYQTHYVGDVRAGRTTILDTYLLKSLDSLHPDLGDGIRVQLFRCFEKRICTFFVMKQLCADDTCRENHDKGGQGLDYILTMFHWVKGGRMWPQVHDLILNHTKNTSCPLEEWDSEGRQKSGYGWTVVGVDLLQQAKVSRSLGHEIMTEGKKKRKDLGADDNFFKRDLEYLVVKSSFIRKYPALLDDLMLIRKDAEPTGPREPVDAVVRCHGWKLDDSIFDSTVPVKTTHDGKYPAITHGFEAKGVPGLFFAGTLTHGLDFRKSAGGFVHGFRYTAQVLFHLLEERNFGIPFPHDTRALPLSGGASAQKGVVEWIVQKIVHRINNAAAPYQMFHTLGDMVVYNTSKISGNGTFASVLYYDSAPISEFHERFQSFGRLTWNFEYGDDFWGPKVLKRQVRKDPVNAHETQFLHPVLRYYAPGKSKPKITHHLFDDVYTVWHAPQFVSPLTRFVASSVAKATGISDKECWGRFAKDANGVIDEEWPPVVDLLSGQDEPEAACSLQAE